MKKKEFLELIKDTIGRDGDIEEGMLLEGIEEYDSLAALSLMAMYDELGVSVVPDDFIHLVSVRDLVALAAEKVTDG